MADDACSAVKFDLKAGTYTKYTMAFPIYIVGIDIFQGGNVYIILRDPWREPVQTVNGPILYTRRGCTIFISSTNPISRDKLYLDVTDILTATNRGYIIKRAKDNHRHQLAVDLPIEVSMLL